jgi:hypothetical protein
MSRRDCEDARLLAAGFRKTDAGYVRRPTTGPSGRPVRAFSRSQALRMLDYEAWR